jgi:hypothetical protein
VGVHGARQDDPGNPGADRRAKPRQRLRPNRGFPLPSPEHVIPPQMLVRIAHFCLTIPNDLENDQRLERLIYYTALPRPQCYPQMELVDQSNQRFVGVHFARQDAAESPGSGGASPYHPAAVTPLELVDQSNQRFVGVHFARQDAAESPASGGASP